MTSLMRFPSAVGRDASIEHWMESHARILGALARHWFQVMRNCGDDVRELMHDGYATACVHDAAFAYVGVFKTHVNVGFFRGAELPDPHRLLEGSGKFMRHVKIRPGRELDESALTDLINVAYEDMTTRRTAEELLRLQS